MVHYSEEQQPSITYIPRKATIFQPLAFHYLVPPLPARCRYPNKLCILMTASNELLFYVNFLGFGNCSKRKGDGLIKRKDAVGN